MRPEPDGRKESDALERRIAVVADYLRDRILASQRVTHRRRHKSPFHPRVVTRWPISCRRAKYWELLFAVADHSITGIAKITGRSYAKRKVTADSPKARAEDTCRPLSSTMSSKTDL